MSDEFMNDVAEGLEALVVPTQDQLVEQIKLSCKGDLEIFKAELSFNTVVTGAVEHDPRVHAYTIKTLGRRFVREESNLKFTMLRIISYLSMNYGPQVSPPVAILESQLSPLTRKRIESIEKEINGQGLVVEDVGNKNVQLIHCASNTLLNKLETKVLNKSTMYALSESSRPGIPLYM